MPSSNEYYKQYRRGERDLKNGNRDDLIEDKIEIKFKSKNINLKHFKDYYTVSQYRK